MTSYLARANAALMEMAQLVAALHDENEKLREENACLKAASTFVPSDRFAPSPPPSNVFGYSYDSDGRKRTLSGSGDVDL